MNLAEVQCHLDREGASDLVIDLIMNATSDRIFQESILLAIALLEGGNPVIQVIILLLHFHDQAHFRCISACCDECKHAYCCRYTVHSGGVGLVVS